MSYYRPSSNDRAIDAVGGRFTPTEEETAAPESLVANVLARAARGLSLYFMDPRQDIGFLRRLPDLEFVVLPGAPDITPLMDLRKLRGLDSERWKRDLDFRHLPALEWLWLMGPKHGQLDSLRHGHPKLHHIEVIRFPYEDLSIFGNLTHLVWLEVSDSRKLSSLGDLGAAAKVLSLAVKAHPDLSVLRGHPTLEVIELFVDGARGLDTRVLELLDALPRLRILAGEKNFVRRDGRWEEPERRPTELLMDSQVINFQR